MKEKEIRPLGLFNDYLSLAKEDAENFFNKSAFVEVPCPACGSEGSDDAFVKYGFKYVICSDCQSLFNSPRPTVENLDDYYRRGKAVQFWGSDFYRVTAEARKEKLFRPRAELVRDYAEKYLQGRAGTFIDVGSGYGLFYEELCKISAFNRLVGIEPSPELAQVCRDKGQETIEKVAEDLNSSDAAGDMAASFEVIEHVFDPLLFLRGISRVMNEEGLLMFTTLTVSGFDLQVLWDKSNSIFPPHHLNLLSVEGYKRLIERAGFELVELSTPGKLDVNIVSNAVEERDDLEVPRFISLILNHKDEAVREGFQVFLQQNKLSSHIRAVIRK